MRLAFIVLVLCSSACATSFNEAVERNITLERSTCYEDCPEYEININSKGEVIFQGKKFTAIQGIANGKIGNEDVKALFHAAEQYKFYELPSNIDEFCLIKKNHFPITKITVTYGNKRHTVSEQECAFLYEDDFEKLQARGVFSDIGSLPEQFNNMSISEIVNQSNDYYTRFHSFAKEIHALVRSEQWIDEK